MRRMLLAVCLVAASLMGAPGPAAAALPCGTSVTGLDAGDLVTAASWLQCPDSAAVQDGNTLAIPMTLTGGSSFLMTTGKAAAAAPSTRVATNWWSEVKTPQGGYDVSSLDLTVAMPALGVAPNRNCLAFSYLLASEEVPAVPGPGDDPSNDGFVAEIDSTDWFASDRRPYPLTAPHNFALTPAGQATVFDLLASGTSDRVPESRNGTAYNWASQPQRAVTEVTPGQHHLYLSLFDSYDWLLDTGVFLDHLRAFKGHPIQDGCYEYNNDLVAADDTRTVTSGITTDIDVLANDTDPDQDVLAVTPATLTTAQGGTATCTTTSCSYTSAALFVGQDSFTYTAVDGFGATDEATVTVDVREDPDALALTADLTPRVVRWPRTATSTVRATTLWGTPSAGRSLELWRRREGGDETLLATVVTDADGRAASTFRPSAQTSLWWRVPGMDYRSDEASVAAQPVVSVAAQRRRVMDRVTGRTTPARPGTRVLLQRKRPGGAWRTVAARRTRVGSVALVLAHGAPYSFTVKAPRGTRVYRVRVPADAGRLAVTSAIRRLR